jgi:putative acetyltransferase
MRIVSESRRHLDAIDALHRAAFGGGYEAALVRALRRDGLVRASLVALDGDDVVGHALFSELAVEMDGRPLRAAALAPIAVRPERQRQGIGSHLIVRGLQRLRAKGFEAVVVLGHSAYYPRFGFSASLAAKLSAPFRGEHFMALELAAGALAGARGAAVYPQAFGLDAGSEREGR